MWKHVSSILATAPNLCLLPSAKWRNICGFLPALKTSSQCDFFFRGGKIPAGRKQAIGRRSKKKFIFHSYPRFPTLLQPKKIPKLFSRHHWLPILRQLRSRKIPRLRCWQMPHFPTAGGKSGASKKGSRNIGIRWLVFVGRRKKNSRTEKKRTLSFPRKKEKKKKIKIDASARISTAFSLVQYILCQRWKEETIGAKRGKEEGTIEGENRPWCTNSPTKSNWLLRAKKWWFMFLLKII